jgi:hypothetical protein
MFANFEVLKKHRFFMQFWSLLTIMQLEMANSGVIIYLRNLLVALPTQLRANSVNGSRAHGVAQVVILSYIASQGNGVYNVHDVDMALY